MTFADAREIIIFESSSTVTRAREGDGIIVDLRMGGDPGHERLQKLMNAMRCVFQYYEGKQDIERELAFALHGIAEEIIALTMIKTPSRSWRREFLDWERFDIKSAAEGILCGSWPDEWMRPWF